MLKKLIGNLSLFIMGQIVGAGIMGAKLGRKISEKQKVVEKNDTLFLLMNQWVQNRQDNKNIAVYLKERNYCHIAIYGMSYVGETLFRELVETEVEVMYGIDRNKSNLSRKIQVCSVEDELPQVDAVVVTAITYYDEIREKLEQKMTCPIISLEEIVYEI